MRSRNSELNQLNNDLVNLLSSLQVPIVMLNDQLRIRRYTPVAEKVLNLIPTDIGRPISDLKPRINVPDLEELLAEVIESVTPLERDLRGTGTVLVVDDEEIALTTMQAILDRNGYRVMTATNGELAINIVREHKDDLSLVILDLAMPVMGGDKALVRITALAPDLPVLLTSGYDATEAVGKLGNDVPAGFIQKPATVTELLETVKRALNKSRKPLPTPSRVGLG